MSNSGLVSYMKLSPNHSGPRKFPISRISIHCVVGQLSVESIGNWLSKTSAQSSCNYGIGTDGRVALIVDEANRSWCTSSKDNDNRAVTIECASDTKHPYAINNAVYGSLIKLCTDICQRNGKKRLLWIPDKAAALQYAPKDDELILTVHRWFANKACPGQWLIDHMPEIAALVTANLKEDEEVMFLYNSMAEIPDYAQPTIAKLIESGAIKGQGGPLDKNKHPTDMGLTLEMIRTFVIIDRAGGFDK